MTKPGQEAATPATETPAPPTSPEETKPTPKKPMPTEIGGPEGPEPTRFGDWERKGRVSDF
ncbi:hypothetical protein HMPREF9946_01040 [Acetobacteraceae bacterium AT-5844]|nr:hypothetical protein HMPREF9946_01040 [Acetobacteraceae bacterium AT-5844]